MGRLNTLGLLSHPAVNSSIAPFSYLVHFWTIRGFTTDNDRQRLLAIILRARDLSISRYHAPFFVVLWGGYGYDTGDDTNEKWITQRLEQNGVPTLRLLPALKSNRFRFPFDGHATANAYTLVANTLNAYLDANV
jgi:hypothetical protein